LSALLQECKFSRLVEKAKEIRGQSDKAPQAKLERIRADEVLNVLLFVWMRAGAPNRAAKLLSKDEARRIAANIARLPELPKKA
jgi:hypothetical protein